MRTVKPLVLATAVLLVGVLFVLAGPAGPAAASGCKKLGQRSDFNGDGIDDVAISAPSLENEEKPGVHVLYGTSTGLTATSPDDQLIESSSTDGSWGQALAAGDFNGDGCTDLAVGDPFATGGGTTAAGSVTIFMGSPSGLTLPGLRLTATAGGGAPVAGAYFGWALATGDLNADGTEDLIIGTANEDAIYVFMGRSGGPTTGKRYAEGVNGVPGHVSGGVWDTNAFGSALATGDFDGDGRDDVAIGAQNETVGSVDAGAVMIMRGSGSVTNPLTTTGAQVWSQGSAGVPGVAEEGDEFGAALATGRFKGSPRWDLAIGAPGETVNGQEGAGAVNVLYSAGSGGLSSTDAKVFDEDVAGVPGPAQEDDEFGSALSGGFFSASNQMSLAVGVPGKTINGQADAGGVVVFYADSSAGPQADQSSLLSQDTAGMGGVAETFDRFGSSLLAVPILDTYMWQLVVGSPHESENGKSDSGMINFIRGDGTGLNGTGSQTFTEGTDGVKGTLCEECLFGMALA